MQRLMTKKLNQVLDVVLTGIYKTRYERGRTQTKNPDSLWQ